VHASLRQLLSLRDGAPVDALCQVHVAECSLCQRELARLQDITAALRALPDTRAPEDGWAAVRARLHRRGADGAAQGPGGWRAWIPGRGYGTRQALFEGMLAGAIAVFAIVAVRLGSSADALPRSSVAEAGATPAGRVVRPTLEQLLAKVQEQEVRLARLERAEAGLGAAERRAHPARLTAIKERIALLDHYCLTEGELPPDVQYQVMLERVSLMDELLSEYVWNEVPGAVQASFEF
jgi:hypothetical protein